MELGQPEQSLAPWGCQGHPCPPVTGEVWGQRVSAAGVGVCTEGRGGEFASGLSMRQQDLGISEISIIGIKKGHWSLLSSSSNPPSKPQQQLLHHPCARCHCK